MVERIVGLDAAAEYNLGFSMADQILEIFWVQFIIVFFPKMITMYENSIKELKKRMNQVVVILLLVYSILFCISILEGERIFSLLFGVQYQKSGIIFTWVIVAVFFTSIFALYYRLLIIANKQHYYLYLMLLGSVLNFILNLIFIPEYGNYGAIVTTIAVNVIIAFIAVRKGTKIMERNYAKYTSSH